MSQPELQLGATLTCPDCGKPERLTMPTEFCLVVHRCEGCGAVLRPRRGDCCVFCSYGDTPCPPVQAARF